MTFSYAGYGSYTALFVLAFVVLAVLALAPLGWRRLRPSTGARTAATMEAHDDPPRP